MFLQGPSDKFEMALKALTDDEKGELKEQFGVLDKDESGFINLSELKEALDLAGFKVPGWRVRDMIDKIDRESTECPGNTIVGQRKLSYGEFEHVSSKILLRQSWPKIFFSFAASSSPKKCRSPSRLRLPRKIIFILMVACLRPVLTVRNLNLKTNCLY